MKKLFIWAKPNQVSVTATIEEQHRQSGFNFGNLLIPHGAISLFPQDLVSFPGDFSCPEEVRETCSHVIYPAANILWEGFDLSFVHDYLRKTGLPVIMLGVGAQTNNRNFTSPISRNTLELMRLVSDRSHSIGVRGHYTAEVLAAHGIHNTTVLGCPSFYMNLAPAKVRSCGDCDLRNIAVNFSRRVNVHSFHPGVLQDLENTLLQLAISVDAEFVAQDELEELLLAAGETQHTAAIASYFDKVPHEDVANFFRSQTRYFTSAQLWSDYIATKSFSIGSRFHGNIIALLSGTPALFIVHDSRTMELCALLGVPYIHSGDLAHKEISVNVLMDKVQGASFAQFEKAHATLIDRMKDFLKRNELDQMSRLQ